MKTILFFALIAFSFAASAQDANPTSQSSTSLSLTGSYLVQQDAINQGLAPVRSQADLGSYMAVHFTKDSPLAALSIGARQRFLSSLVFSSKGLASFDYSALVTELTPTQTYQVMALFGMQRTTALMKGLQIKNSTDQMIMRSVHPTPMACPPYPTPGSGSGCDHEGYRCEGKGTCIQAMSAICTSNC